MISYFYRHARKYPHPLLALPEALVIAAITPFYVAKVYLKEKFNERRERTKKAGIEQKTEPNGESKKYVLEKSYFEGDFLGWP